MAEENSKKSVLSGLEGKIQKFLGYWLLGYIAYLYHDQGYTNFAKIFALSAKEIVILISPLFLVALLIKSLTKKEIIELVKVWKGK